jgi:hypothetical protein
VKEAAEAADAEADAIHSMQVGAAIQCDNDSSVCGDVGMWLQDAKSNRISVASSHHSIESSGDAFAR